MSTEHGRFYLDPFSHFGYFILRDGDYEPDLRSFLENNICDGSVFVDVGAHEGFFSVVAAKRAGQRGRVLAIEPQARLLPILACNLRLNRLENVQIVDFAVSDRAAVRQMYLQPGYNTGGSGFTNRSRWRRPTREVATRRLADILADHGVGRVDVIKIDIEGYEYEAILGSPELFTGRLVDTLAVELHCDEMRARGRNPDDISMFLINSGYALDPRDSHNLESPYASVVFRVTRR